jgi:hypothetical protein
MAQPNTGAVYITLGNGVDLGIDPYGELRIVQRTGMAHHRVTPLGMATKKRINEIKDYLDRLMIHAVDV